MKPQLLILSLFSLITASLIIKFQNYNPATGLLIKGEYFKKSAIGCSPDWDALKDWMDDNDIPPIPGSGSYIWTISTSNDSAQFYFNQGINMYYSFHIIESMASFKKAAKFDPGCAMLKWAEALAYGPNINDLGYAASPDALLAIEKAIQLSENAPEKEKMLILAQNARYTADTTVSREYLNQLYADKMKGIYEKFPADADVAALYADALMLQHPWDLWKIDGTSKPWTPLIQEVLEKLLVQTPNHPGANHYYIHVMEPSPFAYKAIPSADRLGKLTPGLSHTVHMPSHIYLRTGNYAKGVLVNENAVNSYKKAIPLYPAVAGSDFLYEIHNLHMKTNHAMMQGRSAYATIAAEETKKSIQPDYLLIPEALGNYVQYIYMTPVLVDIRFGNWNKLLQQKKPDESMIYANILYHFGRGMAFNNQSKLQAAKSELAQIQTLMKDVSLTIPLKPFSAAIDGATVAENILLGCIALKEKNYSEAIAAFEEAVVTEENMVYNEPRDWMLNPKHYAADGFLKAGSYKEAKEILQKDLLNNKENGWALFGLWKTLNAEKKSAEAAKMLTRYKNAFSKADIKLTGTVF